MAQTNQTIEAAMTNKKKRQTNSIIPMERITQSILLIRGQKVMLDANLAKLYVVETKVLVQAVKRNIERFPEDFMFQLTKQEFDGLRSQSVTSSWGGRRYPPYILTEPRTGDKYHVDTHR